MDKFIDDVLDCLKEEFERPDGVRIQGQSASYLLSSIRDKGWRGMGTLSDFENRCEAAGFILVEAYTLRFHPITSVARRGRRARVVTL